MASMVGVATARAAARKRVERDRRSWSVGGAGDAVLDLPLHPPTEREVRSASGVAQDWVRSWRDQPGVVWTTRAWASFGTQQVPDRIVLHGADAIAAFAGREVAGGWREMRDAVHEVRQRFGDSDPLQQELRRSASAIADLDVADRVRLVAVLDWLVEHPDSRLLPRQLPVHGVHTKWLERHRGLVTRLHTALTGRESLGLAEKPALIRLRVLDPALRPTGLEDLTLPVAELAALTAPEEVLVLENLENLLALPPLHRTIAVLGGGYGVGGRMRDIPWMRTAHLRYWGDLDSHGFRILDDLRATFSSVESVLMDLETLDAHRDLAVQEESMAMGDLRRLTPAETTALAALRAGGGLRVEQERLGWEWVLPRLRADGRSSLRADPSTAPGTGAAEAPAAP